jgi:hypothetical protein
MDPVHSKAVDDLGPEVRGVREGPTHRPGQPCNVCHGGDGPGSPDFVAAGTVYEDSAYDTSPIPKQGVRVILTDARDASVSDETNAVGNFYVTTQQWTRATRTDAPTYPLYVKLRFGDVEKPMLTPIGRDGGCGSCHHEHGDLSHMPVVGLKDTKDQRP